MTNNKELLNACIKRNSEEAKKEIIELLGNSDIVVYVDGFNFDIELYDNDVARAGYDIEHNLKFSYSSYSTYIKDTDSEEKIQKYADHLELVSKILRIDNRKKLNAIMTKYIESTKRQLDDISK